MTEACRICAERLEQECSAFADALIKKPISLTICLDVDV